MQFDTTTDQGPDTSPYGTRTYADMHGKPPKDKTPLQALLGGLRSIMDELETIPTH